MLHNIYLNILRCFKIFILCSIHCPFQYINWNQHLVISFSACRKCCFSKHQSQVMSGLSDFDVESCPWGSRGKPWKASAESVVSIAMAQ